MVGEYKLLNFNCVCMIGVVNVEDFGFKKMNFNLCSFYQVKLVVL